MSERRRSSEVSPPLSEASRMTSPGLRKSRLWRMPGRLRIAARSSIESCRRRKIESRVSLRLTTTATAESSGGRAAAAAPPSWPVGPAVIAPAAATAAGGGPAGASAGSVSQASDASARPVTRPSASSPHATGRARGASGGAIGSSSIACCTASNPRSQNALRLRSRSGPVNPRSHQEFPRLARPRPCLSAQAARPKPARRHGVDLRSCRTAPKLAGPAAGRSGQGRFECRVRPSS